MNNFRGFGGDFHIKTATQRMLYLMDVLQKKVHTTFTEVAEIRITQLT